MPVVEKFFCYFLSLTSIHCGQVHDYANLIGKQIEFDKTSNKLDIILLRIELLIKDLNDHKLHH